MIQLYTDGGCTPNPGPGGWAWVVASDGRSGYGYDPDTTNNRMELTAVIRGLQALPLVEVVTVYSDSQYITRAWNEGWLNRWAAANWRSGKKQVVNPDLWMALLQVISRRGAETHFVWVKGHNGNVYNEKADALVGQAIRERP